MAAAPSTERSAATPLAWLAALGRGMLADGPLAIAVFDAGLHHVAVSPLLEDMNGRPAAELLGRTPVEVHGEAVRPAQDQYARVLATGEPVTGQAFAAALASDPDHERHWLLDVVRIDADGTGPGVAVLVREVTEQVEAERARDDLLAELRRRADHDALTGLPNRDALARTFARDPAAWTSVVFLDLDGFKAVNDHLGHAAGDALLVRIATAMRGALDDDELLARVGGDEFVALTHRDGRQLAARLRRAVAATRSGVPGSTLSASCGVADVGVGEALSEAVSRADAAMFVEKGRMADRD